MKVELFGVSKDTFARVATTIITKTIKFLTHQFDLDEDLLWKLVYKCIQELDKRGFKFYLRDDITNVLHQVDEYIVTKVESDVDDAIKEFKDLTEKNYPPIIPVFSETEEGPTPLGGELRLRAPWVDKDPET